MQPTRAGGCLLTLSIFVGFLIGVARNNPVQGAVIGTMVGALLALVLFLADRRR